MKTVTLIDGDTLVWRVAYKFSEQELQDDQHWQVENQTTLELKQIMDKTATEYMVGFLGDGLPTFRDNLALSVPYKGNRKEKPDWYVKVSPIIKKFLKAKYGFQMVSGIEVDDVLSMTVHSLKEDHELIIAGIDKDLLQIPGKHYNYGNDSWLLVHPEVAEKTLWLQVLTGDSTDNIQGLPGIGPKKAEAILAEHSIDKYPFVVLAAYIKKFGVRVGTLKFSETTNLIMMLPEGKSTPELIANPFKASEGGTDDVSELFNN